jgi:hypothetical protein
MKHGSSPKTITNRIKNIPPNWRFFVLGTVLAAGLLSWLLRSSSEPAVPPTSSPGTENVTYIKAEDLSNQFRDCIKVATPKNTTLEDELPLGEYKEYEYKFKLEIQTEKGLSEHEEELISSCTGINRLYELKPLLEQRCKCKIDIICPC